jgi:hypothetical protein
MRSYALASLIFLDGLAGGVLGLCIFLALVDPVLLGVTRGALLIRESSDGENPQRVSTLTDITNSDGVDEARQRLLHDILDHVGDGDEHSWVDQSPEKLDQIVEPFNGFGSRRRIDFSSLTVHVVSHL